MGRPVVRCLLTDANGIQHIDKRILITVRVSGSGGLLQYLRDDDRDVSGVHRPITVGVTRQQSGTNHRRTKQHDGENKRQADIEKFFPDQEQYSNHGEHQQQQTAKRQRRYGHRPWGREFHVDVRVGDGGGIDGNPGGITDYQPLNAQRIVTGIGVTGHTQT